MCRTIGFDALLAVHQSLFFKRDFVIECGLSCRRIPSLYYDGLEYSYFMSAFSITFRSCDRLSFYKNYSNASIE